MVLPEAHWLAENSDAQAAILQIGRAGEPEGTCSHHDGIEIHVSSILPCGSQIAQPFLARRFLKQYLIVKDKFRMVAIPATSVSNTEVTGWPFKFPQTKKTKKERGKQIPGVRVRRRRSFAATTLVASSRRIIRDAKSASGG
jgi:hypothetical protein